MNLDLIFQNTFIFILFYFHFFIFATFSLFFFFLLGFNFILLLISSMSSSQAPNKIMCWKIGSEYLFDFFNIFSITNLICNFFFSIFVQCRWSFYQSCLSGGPLTWPSDCIGLTQLNLYVETLDRDWDTNRKWGSENRKE